MWVIPIAFIDITGTPSSFWSSLYAPKSRGVFKSKSYFLTQMEVPSWNVQTPDAFLSSYLLRIILSTKSLIWSFWTSIRNHQVFFAMGHYALCTGITFHHRAARAPRPHASASNIHQTFITVIGTNWLMLRGDSEKREGLEDAFIMDDEIKQKILRNKYWLIYSWSTPSLIISYIPTNILFPLLLFYLFTILGSPRLVYCRWSWVILGTYT